MKKIILGVLITIMIVGSGSGVYACGPGGQGHERMGKGMGPGMGHDMGPGRGGHGGHPLLNAPWGKIVEVAGEAGITDDQLDALQKVRKDMRESSGQLKLDMKNMRMELHELMVTSEAADQKAALTLAQKINEIQGKLMQNNIKAVFQIKTILKPEQLTQLKKIAMEKRKEHRGKRKQNRHGFDGE